ncbi:Caffeine resistance protein 5 [Colletotrichum orbiculare MAFF 240422]|uniref:Caffeine resistance protein 5 n=1 Tax=Colletotrichum orbiculare (strain 104-T / ATCC 96160 / CBS 514.97 / LARS 414 / MAFF 240422) TaxID=1213857 RepID=A0A484FKB9_COLOR|nr:Caffeine resistance protein 5 [Colletotrichum orbiculare MAFF 240422]
MALAAPIPSTHLPSPSFAKLKALLVLILGTLLIAGADLASQDFRINTNDKTGAIDKITDPRSNNAMNWVSTGANASWLSTGSRWGFGYADLGQDSLHRSFWNFPQFTKRDGVVEAVYTTGGLELLVRRSVNDDDAGGTTALAIYTPFSDHYTNTTDCVAARSLAHIWANGGASSWVKLDQMGGNYRNFGLVLTKGALAGYSVESRDSVTMCNTRGVFLLSPSIPTLIPTLQPGEASAFEWTWFLWEDFFEQRAVRSKQFIRVKSNSNTFVGEETGSITLSGASVNSNARVYGQAVQCADGVCQYNFTAGSPAQTTLTISTDSGYNATAYLNTVPAHNDVVDSRTRFIIENQQDSTPNTPADGAYRVFDNQAMVLATWDTWTDRNPGRERVGMGIVVARWLKKNPDNVKVRGSLEKYYIFVSTSLQEENGFVRDRPIGMGRGRKRLYNWPWVLQFHITVAALDLNLTDPVADETPLERFMMMTLEHFYANEVPSCTPSVCQSSKACERSKLHLDMMLRFAGKQPDDRLHDVSIRHWDGFWFGTDQERRQNLVSPLTTFRKLTGNKLTCGPKLVPESMMVKDVVMMPLIRPFILKSKEPMLFLLSLYITLTYGLLYIWFDSPIVFVEIYSFSFGLEALAFLGVLIGAISSFRPFSFTTTRTSRHLEPQFGENGGIQPEKRLPPVFAGALAIPISLLWFGWGARPDIHWTMPIIGSHGSASYRFSSSTPC